MQVIVMAQVHDVAHVLHRRTAQRHATVGRAELHVAMAILAMERDVYPTVYTVQRTAQNNVQGVYHRLVQTMNG